MKNLEKDEKVHAFYRLVLKRNKRIEELEKLIKVLEQKSTHEKSTQIRENDSEVEHKDDDERLFSLYKFELHMESSPLQLAAHKKLLRQRKREKWLNEWEKFKKYGIIKKILAILFCLFFIATILFAVIMFLFCVLLFYMWVKSKF